MDCMTICNSGWCTYTFLLHLSLCGLSKRLSVYLFCHVFFDLLLQLSCLCAQSTAQMSKLLAPFKDLQSPVYERSSLALSIIHPSAPQSACLHQSHPFVTGTFHNFACTQYGIGLVECDTHHGSAAVIVSAKGCSASLALLRAAKFALYT